MFDVNDDTRAGYRRIEMLTGPGRRRRWSLEDKARVVVESFAPGARPSEVARRWQICPQQVFAWRREARMGLLALPSEMAASLPADPGFVSILTEPTMPPVTSAPTPALAIEVEIAGAVVRVLSGVDAALLTSVLRAVRASAVAA